MNAARALQHGAGREAEAWARQHVRNPKSPEHQEALKEHNEAIAAHERARQNTETAQRDFRASDEAAAMSRSQLIRIFNP